MLALESRPVPPIDRRENSKSLFGGKDRFAEREYRLGALYSNHTKKPAWKGRAVKKATVFLVSLGDDETEAPPIARDVAANRANSPLESDTKLHGGAMDDIIIDSCCCSMVWLSLGLHDSPALLVCPAVYIMQKHHLQR